MQKKEQPPRTTLDTLAKMLVPLELPLGVIALVSCILTLFGLLDDRLSTMALIAAMAVSNFTTYSIISNQSCPPAGSATCPLLSCFPPRPRASKIPP